MMPQSAPLSLSRARQVTAGGDQFVAKFATFSAGASAVVAQVADSTGQGTGLYTVAYVMPSTGSFSLAVSLQVSAATATAIANSPAAVSGYYSSYAFSSTSSRVGGPGAVANASVAAGTVLTLYVISTDSQGVPLSSGGLALTVASGATALTSQFVDNGDGTYWLYYTSTAAGFFPAVGAYANGNLLGSGVFPLPLTVAPGPADPVASLVDLGSLAGAAGSAAAGTLAVAAGAWFAFNVAAADAYGNAIGYSGYSTDAFAASMTSVAGSACLAQSSQYAYSPCLTLALGAAAPANWSANGTATAAAAYSVVVTLAGTAITNTPFALTVNPQPAVSAAYSYVVDNPSGANGLYYGTVGAPGAFYVYPVDAYGNAMSLTGSLACAVALSGAAALNGTCAAADPSSAYAGALLATYTALQAGTYSVSVAVTLGGVKTSLYSGSLAVAQGPPSPAKCAPLRLAPPIPPLSALIESHRSLLLPA